MPTASVSAEITIGATIREVLGTGLPASSNNEARVTHSAYAISETIDGTTPVPSTKAVSFSQALASGTATIDLTSLTGANGASVTGAGLKVQYFYMEGASGNTGAITATEGASNGYELGGNGWTMAVTDGQALAFYGNEDAPDIGTSTKTIDLAGTGTESVKIQIIMG